MPSNRELVRRIKTAGNISKITKAMEAVAASKMKKAQQTALAGVSYEQLMRKMAEHIVRFSNIPPHPLLSGEVGSSDLPVLYVVMTPDRGLCGSLHGNVFRLAESKINDQSAVVIVGKKASGYARRTDWSVIAQVDTLGEYPQFQDTFPVSRVVLDEYLGKRVGSIQLIYPKFQNTLFQVAVCDSVLPLRTPFVAGEHILRPKYLFEPSATELLDELLPAYVRMSIYQAVLSMKAAEQSARMVSMKNASDNARSLGELLQFMYNQNRQQMITSEIADIVTATMALS